MLDNEKEHKFFGDCWRMFNAVRKDNSDAGWERCTATARALCEKKENKRFHEKIALAVIDEAEHEIGMDIKERQSAYKKAGAVFQASWELFENFMTDIDAFRNTGMQQLTDFNALYDCQFATALSAAIYEVVCNYVHGEGDFMATAYRFYEKYKGGITVDMEPKAYADAEDIVNSHPQYMLHMMGMYEDLKKRAC